MYADPDIRRPASENAGRKVYQRLVVTAGALSRTWRHSDSRRSATCWGIGCFTGRAEACWRIIMISFIEKPTGNARHFCWFHIPNKK